MTEEVATVRNMMQKTHYSADLYEPTLQSVLRLCAVTNLAAGWNSYVSHISAADLLALRWCSQAITGEIGLTHDELQSLLDAINAFKERVESENLPESIREFILQQIELMIRGIHQYPIIGRRAARDAIRRAVGDVMDVDESISSNAPTGHKEQMAKLWKVLLASVEGSEKMVKAVTGIAEQVPKLKGAISTAASLIS